MKTIIKPTWCIHYVLPEGKEQLVDCHSHGIEDSLNHLDFQIVLPIEMNLASGLINSLAYMIKEEGRVFKEDVIYTDVLQNNVPVKFIKVHDSSINRDLLRLILPDENLKFPEDSDCKDMYNLQYNPTHETSGKDMEIHS